MIVFGYGMCWCLVWVISLEMVFSFLGLVWLLLSVCCISLKVELVKVLVMKFFNIDDCMVGLEYRVV